MGRANHPHLPSRAFRCPSFWKDWGSQTRRTGISLLLWSLLLSRTISPAKLLKDTHSLLGRPSTINSEVLSLQVLFLGEEIYLLPDMGKEKKVQWQENSVVEHVLYLNEGCVARWSWGRRQVEPACQSVSISSCCYNKNTIDWVVLYFIGCEHDLVLMRSPLQIADFSLLPTPLHGSRKEDKRALRGLFYEDTNLFTRAPPSWPNCFPRAPPSNTLTLGAGISRFEFWGWG